MDARIVAAGVVSIGLLAHAAFPRYDWRDPGGPDRFAYIRVDRWTGRAEWGLFRNTGEWQKVQAPTAAQGARTTNPDDELEDAIREADRLLSEGAERK